jgi:hypothetical protein
VRDRLILAFVGERCVGAGKVDRFRKDLLEARLGDGYCGFDFPIKLTDDEKLGSVIVKLQNSDVALLQRTTRLVGPDDALLSQTADLGAIAPPCVSWMQDRGWLEQQEYDFLKAVQTIGAYERGLRPARRPGQAPGNKLLAGLANGSDAADPLAPEQIVRDLLALYALSDVNVVQTRIASISELAVDTSPTRGKGLSVMALWSSESCRIMLEERSHMQPAPSASGRTGMVTAKPGPGAIEYSFGPDRILFVHRHASFAPDGFAPKGGISVFTATERSALRTATRAIRGEAVHAAL